MSKNLKSADNSIKVDCRDQRYFTYPNGQVCRLSPEGLPIPRVRLSKKERLKLRKEYREARGLDATDLKNKILETPVINPSPNNNDSSESEDA